MHASKTVLFLCPHNAAKSVIAAAYWNRLAAERGLDIAAVSAGTEPSPAVAPAVVEALRAEGLDVAGHQPRRATEHELAAAWRVVSMGCAPRDLAAVAVERWDDVPAASEDLPACLGAIRYRVQHLLSEAS